VRYGALSSLQRKTPIQPAFAEVGEIPLSLKRSPPAASRLLKRIPGLVSVGDIGFRLTSDRGGSCARSARHAPASHGREGAIMSVELQAASLFRLKQYRAKQDRVRFTV
jgi:hypothetical protein